MTGSYHTWRAAPRPNYRKPDPSEGSAVLTSRQAAIEETLSEKAKEQIRTEAKEAAAEALAAFEAHLTEMFADLVDEERRRCE